MWTEAFLNHWTALDATLKTAPVDADAHQADRQPARDRLAAEPFLALVQVMGNLKIKVQEVKGQGLQGR